MMIEGHDVIVRHVNLPVGVKGFVAPSPDDTQNIYINARWSYAVQRQTLLHELRHILRDDFAEGEDLFGVESDRGK